MARTWLSIRVDLIEGGGRTLWPRPGCVFAAARSHTFAALADAIDTAFARWDRSHLCLFGLADGTAVHGPIRWRSRPKGSVFASEARLSRLGAAEQLLFTLDMGDDWTHLCTVGEQRIDPLQTLGITPAAPLPYWGWGEIPTSTAGAPKTTTRNADRCRPAAHRSATAAALLGTALAVTHPRAEPVTDIHRRPWQPPRVRARSAGALLLTLNPASAEAIAVAVLFIAVSAPRRTGRRTGAHSSPQRRSGRPSPRPPP